MRYPAAPLGPSDGAFVRFGVLLPWFRQARSPALWPTHNAGPNASPSWGLLKLRALDQWLLTASRLAPSAGSAGSAAGEPKRRSLSNPQAGTRAGSIGRSNTRRVDGVL